MEADSEMVRRGDKAEVLGTFERSHTGTVRMETDSDIA
jgi:hypothetical protein